MARSHMLASPAFLPRIVRVQRGRGRARGRPIPSLPLPLPRSRSRLPPITTSYTWIVRTALSPRYIQLCTTTTPSEPRLLDRARVLSRVEHARGEGGADGVGAAGGAGAGEEEVLVLGLEQKGEER
ncbi:hypothetical protein B0H14DRAFT_3139591 [Mycena olivaceomarginata]|nr:hypothetical protein B0H14DRAFT_3139591 [Mycena olivaceomarginata]